MKVAFVGLGVMGFPMAGHLAKAGHEMAVFNRSPEKAQRWVAAQRRPGRRDAWPRPPRAPRSSSLCVGNDDDVRQVGRREALPAHGARARCVVDHTTTSAVVAREMAELARGARPWLRRRAGLRRPGGAENGQLTIMCGGDARPPSPRPSR